MGFDNETLWANNYDFRGALPIQPQVTTAGQLPIGTGGSPAIKVGQITSSTLTVAYSDPDITIEAGATMATTYAADTGTATPAANTINLVGGTNGIDTTASGSTVTLNFDVTEQPAIPTSVATDSGTTTPATNSFTIAGTGGITTSGSGSTVTIDGSGTGAFTTNTVTAKAIEWDDFITTGGGAGSSLRSKLDWSFSTTNITLNADVLSLTFQPDNSHLGVCLFGTNSIVTKTMSHTGPYLVLGGGIVTITWIVNLRNLSDVTDAYNVEFGLYDSDLSDSIYFRYTHSENSGNWTVNCTAASTPTTGNTSNTADINWHKFQFVVNAAATSVTFKIDGTEVSGSPITTNIPTDNLRPRFVVNRTAGSADRDIYLDFYSHEIEFTTPR
jgi:hypothetical protein